MDEKKITVDVTGLAQGVRSGVQNVLWGLVDAAANPANLNNHNILFYDRSGYFNEAIYDSAGLNYKSLTLWHKYRLGRRLSRFLIKAGCVNNSYFKDAVNLVWNYDIYNPSISRPAIYIHDILPIEYPYWFESEFRKLTEVSLNFAKKKAKFILCNSYYVKGRLIEVLGIEDHRIEVVYPAIDSSYFDTYDLNNENKILEKYDLIRGKFIISSGFLDPRKNLQSQIKAYLRYAAGGDASIKYVITGPKNKFSDQILKEIEKCDVSANIIFLGYVPQSELRSLIRSSLCVLYCSIAEGFGLPIIEAMASGVPVITSNTTSMKELGTGRARLVNPHDINDIAKGIDEVVNLSAYARESQVASNFMYAKQFTSQNFLSNLLLAVSK